MTEQGAGIFSDDVPQRPPYAPFATVKNFIERLKEHGMPHRIDKTVMKHLSGAAQSHLLGALRFLKLVDKDGNPSPAMHALVDAAGTDQWSKVLADAIQEPYAPYIAGFNLSNATMGQLQEAFRREGRTEGTVTEKAIRFYMKALDESKIPYSKHIVRTRGVRAASRPRKRSTEESPSNGQHAPPPPPPVHERRAEQTFSETNTISFPIHLPGKPEGRIIVPKDIEEEEVAMVEAAITYLRLYAKRNATKPGQSAQSPGEGRRT